MNRRQLLQQLSGFTLALGGSQILKGCGRSQPDASSSKASFANLTEINFGILTTEEEPILAKKWRPFLAAMSSAVGLPVKPFFAEQYSSLIESMRTAVTPVVWCGGKTYIEAATVSDARAFALTVSDTGEKGYYAHLITHGDRPWLKQVGSSDPLQYLLERGQDISFAFNDINSTSGYLVPMYYLFSQNQINPLDYFANVSFLGSHEATASAISKQYVDVATNNSEAVQRFSVNYPDEFPNLQIIWTSPLIPADPIVYDENLPDNLKTKIRTFFYNYDDQPVLQALGWSGFEPAEDKDWNPIRELKIGKQIMDIQQSDTIETQEKETIIRGLQQKLDRLQSDLGTPNL